MVDGARISLQDEIDYAVEQAKMLDELAAAIEHGIHGKNIRGETAPKDAIEALEYGARTVRQHAVNMQDIRAEYDHKVSIPVDPPA